MTTGTYELTHGITAPAESAAPPASAALGIRLLATAVDAVVIGATVTIAAVVTHLLFGVFPRSVRGYEPVGLLVLGAVVVAGYFVYYWGVEGATPGKRMMGLCVTRPAKLEAQLPIGLGRATLRLIGATAGNLFFADLLFALLHQDRRALHDLMADSIVVPRR
ncbi:MAG TPA: RDD family protein [Thermoanaerobaculia bacterium]